MILPTRVRSISVPASLQSAATRSSTSRSCPTGPESSVSSLMSSNIVLLEHDHRPQRLAALHRGKGVLGLVEADRARDDLVEVELALLVPLRQHWEVTRRQTVAIPGDPEAAAEIEELLQRQLECRSGARHADQHAGAGEIAAEERLRDRLRPADRLERVVDAVPAGELLDALHRVAVARVNRVGGAELPGPIKLARVDVDGDDR